jgi:hypothetical protein
MSADSPTERSALLTKGNSQSSSLRRSRAARARHPISSATDDRITKYQSAQRPCQRDADLILWQSSGDANPVTLVLLKVAGTEMSSGTSACCSTTARQSKPCVACPRPQRHAPASSISWRGRPECLEKDVRNGCRLRLQLSCGIAGGDLKSGGAPLSPRAYRVRAYRSRLLCPSALHHRHRGSGILSGRVQQEPCIARWSA